MAPRTQWFLAGMLLCVAGTGTPAEPEQLTITQAVQLALANTPDLQAAEQRLEAAQARVGMARSRYLPQVSFNGIAKLGLAGATNGLALLGLPSFTLLPESCRGRKRE